MPVSRFNRLSAALAAARRRAHSTPDACPVLVPTERMIERGRVIKDDGEIGRSGSRPANRPAAVEVPRAGSRGTLRDRDRRRHRRGPAASRVSSGRPSRQSWRRGPTAPAARPARRTRCDGRGWGGAGLWGRLRRILRGSYPDGSDRADAGPSFAVCSTPSPRPAAAIAAVGRASRRARSTRGARRADRHGLGEAFGHGTGHGLGSRCTRSRGSAARSPDCRRRCSSRAWCSQSSRARTSRSRRRADRRRCARDRGGCEV